MTGFGILGYAWNLAQTQQEEVSFVLHTLPSTLNSNMFNCFVYYSVLNHIDKVSTRAAKNGLNFKLKEGFSAETSGILNTSLVGTLLLT